MTLVEELQKLSQLAQDSQEEATRAISEAKERANLAESPQEKRLSDYLVANWRLRQSLSRLLTPDQPEDIFNQGVFPSRDSKRVWGTTAVGATHLNVKGTSEVVLGDNLDVSVARGNIYSVNLAYNDKGMLKYPAKEAGTSADDSEGPMIISLEGISSETYMGEVVLQEEDFYDDLDLPDIDHGAEGKVRVTMANVAKTKLLQGSLHAASAKQIVNAEWLDSKQAFPAVENCEYASFTLAGADPIGSDTDQIPLRINAVGSEQSKNFFDADGMQAYDHILMPEKMKEHISSGEVSRLEYTKSACQVSVTEMDTSANISYSKNSSSVFHSAESHTWTVMAATKSTDTYSAATMENEMTVVAFTTKVMGTDLFNALGCIRFSSDAYIIRDFISVSTGFESHVGAKIKSGMVAVKNRVVTLASDAASLAVSCFNFENAQVASRDASVELVNRGVVAQQGAFSILSPRVQMVMSSCQIMV